MFGRFRKGGDGYSARLLYILPLLLALVAFILSLITLLAGYKPDFMPETHIVLLDTSRLGKDLIQLRSDALLPTTLVERQFSNPVTDKVDETKDKLKDEADKAADKTKEEADKAKDKAKEEADKAKDKVKDEAGKVIGDIIDGVTGALGVDKWYALHATTICSGSYTNGNDSSGGLDVRRCTAPLEDLDIIDIIGLDLKVPGPIRDALDDLDAGAPKIFQAVAGIYIAGAALAGTAMLGAVAALLLPGKARMLSLLNLATSSLAAVALFAASLMTTIAADKIADLVRDKASRIGLRAEVGTKFRGLSWAAFALIAAAALFWVYSAFTSFRRSRRGGGAWAKGGDAGSSTRGGSYEMGDRSRR